MPPIKHGPIIANAAGKIGSGSFQRSKTGTVIKPRMKNANPPSPRQSEFRGLLALANAAWRTLTPTERQAWADLAANITTRNKLGDPYRPTGHNLFVAAVMRQGGATNLTSPPPAGGLGRAPRISPLLIDDLQTIKLAGFDRDLATDENALCRVLQPGPASWRRLPHRILRYTTTTPLEGLGEGLQQNFYITTTSSILTGTLTSPPPGDFTFELWFLPRTSSLSGNRTLLQFAAPEFRVRPYFSGAFLIDFGNTSFNSAPSPSLNVWHYLVVRHDSVSMETQIFLDANLIYGPTVTNGCTFSGPFTLGGYAGSTLLYLARLGFCSITATLFSDPAISYWWNDGHGRDPLLRLPPDHLWMINQTDGLTVTDHGTYANDLTTTDFTLTPGQFNRNLLLPEERWPPANGQLQTITQALDPTRLTALSSRANITW